MSSRVTTTPSYRPILKSALHHVFVKRDVWFFGIFALILGSGSALETVLRARNGIEAFDAPFLNRLFPYAEILRQWVDQLAVLPSIRSFLTVTILAATAIGLILLGALSQGVIIHGAKSRRTDPHLSVLIDHAKANLGRVLVVDLVMKVALALCVVVLLAPLFTRVPVFSDVLLFLQAVVGYGLMLVVSLLGIFTLTAILNHGANPKEGFQEAWSLLRKNPSASLETVFLLFLLNFLVGLGVLLFLLLLSLPYTFFFLLGATGGSVLATTLSSTITFLIAIASLVLLGGATTAYNYTVLAMLYERLRTGRFKSKLQRLRTTRYWF